MPVQKKKGEHVSRRAWAVSGAERWSGTSISPPSSSQTTRDEAARSGQESLRGGSVCTGHMRI